MRIPGVFPRRPSPFRTSAPATDDGRGRALAARVAAEADALRRDLAHVSARLEGGGTPSPAELDGVLERARTLHGHVYVLRSLADPGAAAAGAASSASPASRSSASALRLPGSAW